MLRIFSGRVKGVGGVFYERKKTSNSLSCGWGEVIRKESEARRNSVSLFCRAKVNRVTPVRVESEKLIKMITATCSG